MALLFLACAGARPARAEAMLQLFNLSWNEVAFYPAGQKSDALSCQASVTLPAGSK